MNTESLQDKFVTVLTFTYPQEAVMVRGRLESEGIECFVKDELTAQVNPFYSNAIGGVKLQVKESDLEKAVEILRETGYIKDEDLRPAKSDIILDRFTSGFPLIGKLSLEVRLVILSIIFILLIASIAYFAILPTTQ